MRSNQSDWYLCQTWALLASGRMVDLFSVFYFWRFCFLMFPFDIIVRASGRKQRCRQGWDSPLLLPLLLLLLLHMFDCNDPIHQWGFFLFVTSGWMDVHKDIFYFYDVCVPPRSFRPSECTAWEYQVLSVLLWWESRIKGCHSLEFVA